MLDRGRDQRAEEMLRRELAPGEAFTGGIRAYADSRFWLGYLTIWLTFTSGAVLLDFFSVTGVLSSGTQAALVAIVFLVVVRPLIPMVYLATTTDHRLVCCRLASLTARPTRLFFAVPLARVRIATYDSGPFGKLRFTVPGHGRITRFAGLNGKPVAAFYAAMVGPAATRDPGDPPYPSVATS